jgi:hypothetical protein
MDWRVSSISIDPFVEIIVILEGIYFEAHQTTNSGNS